MISGGLRARLLNTHGKEGRREKEEGSSRSPDADADSMRLVHFIFLPSVTLSPLLIETSMKKGSNRSSVNIDRSWASLT